MLIEYRTGNLLEGPEEFIAHCTNCQGAMGSGFAKAAYEKYPEVKIEYLKLYRDQGRKLHLGQTQAIRVGNKTIFNIMGQEFYGNAFETGVVYVNYDAIRAGIKYIDSELFNWSGSLEVAFPLIGAGLAGGSWKIISEIIEEESVHFLPIVYLLDGKVPTT